MRPCLSACLLLLAGAVPCVPTALAAEVPPPPMPVPPARKIDFNRDVRPILSDHCFTCHGPDGKQRKAQLRLDTGEGVRAVDKKELVARVTSHDADAVMPPPKTGKKLTPEQVATLKTWIDEGAAWSGHWSFTKPVRLAIPVTHNWGSKVLNPIDAFVADRAMRAGVMQQSPPTDKVTLIRRVTLDLTGLPPTPEEVDAFLKDNAADAYEKVVDRLLASPRFGERMAWRWLEAARYADTNGYQTDAGRDMWRWRDWVIETYNRNLPFDQFTIEQLAGDLLPNPTLDQRIATGFNRNHRGNSEGGIVPEEYAVEYVADRVETTATVWLGLTFTCCRCHDHKFDPFPQIDFYRMFAFFNNVPEKGRAEKYGNSRPFIKAPTREQQKQLAELDAKVKTAEAAWAKIQPNVAKAVEEWAKGLRADEAEEKEWFPGRELQKSWSLAAPIVFDGEKFTSDAAAGDFGFDDRFSFAMWVSSLKTTGALLSRGPDEPRAEGYLVELVDGKVRVSFSKRWLDDSLRLETTKLVEAKSSTHIAVTYDGTRLASGVKVYVNGVPQKTTVLLNELNQTFQNKQPFRIGAGGGPDNRYRGFMNDVLIYDRVLDATEVAQLAEPASITKILRKRSSDRTPGERAKLTACFMERHAPVDLANPLRDLLRVRDARQSLLDTIPTTMVMEEMSTPRDTHILLRGEYDKKGQKVTPWTPGVLTPVADAPGSPKVSNRLDFAKWLVSKENPLTARVAVNRAWQMHFGVGLVKTAEDFGTQGAYPTHPELLDWLATEFSNPSPTPPPRGEGLPVPWDVKRLHKLIVTSATYKQSSQITKESLAKDPENKLLARFPRLRLSSEMLRDQALFTSGLLVEKLGGPSVKPYQPAGLWNELSGTGDYTPDTGEGLYRRSLYTYWKRTSPPPVMAAFDAAGRETCWVRENRTNTPLQALTLLNETAFVEAARVMAQRVMREAKTTDERLTRAFRLATGRPPMDREMAVIRKSFDFQLAEFRKNPPGIQKFMAIGEAKPDAKLDPAELAAYATICNLLLNLDEVLTKE